MYCPFPIKVPQETEGLLRLVPCAKCTRCRINQKQALVVRMLLEHKQHEHSRFLTLTYEDDPGELPSEDWTKFMKRHRKHYGECRFLAVGEYGGQTGRGHWHAIVFGQKAEPVPQITLKSWDHGFVYDKPANDKAIRYVAGYVLKKQSENSPYPKLMRQSLKPPIGAYALHELGVQLGEANKRKNQIPLGWPSKIRVDGKMYPLGITALKYIKEGYFKVGGRAPAALDPEYEHALVYSAAEGDRSWLGTHLKKEAAQKVEHHSYAKNQFTSRSH